MSTSPHRIDITAGTPPHPEETPPSLRALTYAFLAYASSLFATEPNATATARRRRVRVCPRRRQPPDNLIVILIVFLLASNMLWSTLIKIVTIIVVCFVIDNMLFHGDGRGDRRIGRAFSIEISWMGVCKFTVMSLVRPRGSGRKVRKCDTLPHTVTQRGGVPIQRTGECQMFVTIMTFDVCATCLDELGLVSRGICSTGSVISIFG
ncbi:hypothetical protein P8452_05955 [Trifolium repens]|nr:hypothetical protein P8452_05955 [Trifolium repens]